MPPVCLESSNNTRGIYTGIYIGVLLFTRWSPFSPFSFLSFHGLAWHFRSPAARSIPDLFDPFYPSIIGANKSDSWHSCRHLRIEYFQYFPPFRGGTTRLALCQSVIFDSPEKEEKKRRGRLKRGPKNSSIKAPQFPRDPIERVLNYFRGETPTETLFPIQPGSHRNEHARRDDRLPPLLFLV